MAFAHASVYEPPASDAGLRVLIMRLWPRGVRKDRIDVWLKDAAPSRELLDGYHHHDRSWQEFEGAYCQQIREERPHVLDQLRNLETEHGRVTLLCFERIPPHEHCHRITLMHLLNQRSV